MVLSPSPVRRGVWFEHSWGEVWAKMPNLSDGSSVNPIKMSYPSILVLILSGFSVGEVFGQTTFLDVQATVGLNFTHEIDTVCYNPPIGSGSAWADYDNDGDVDLYLTSMGGVSRLYQNQGDTNQDNLPDFIDMASSLGVAIENWTAGVVFVDYDNDGDQDLYVTRWGGNFLFRNELIENGSAVFEDVTLTAGVGDADRALTATWADYDQDGWVDLFLPKHFDCLPDVRETRDALFRNNGDGTFTNVSQYLCADGSLTCDQLNESHAATASWQDYDNDGDPDLCVPGDVIAAGYENILWRNDGPDGFGGWVFTDVSVESGCDYSLNCRGLGVGDYDNDGHLDFSLTHSEGGFLMHNNGDATYSDVSTQAGIRRILTPHGDVAVTQSTLFFDYDNDGWLDLFYVAGMISASPVPQPDALFRNDHDGTFTEVSVETGVNDDRRGRSSSICDFDQDGFVDLFVGNFGQPIDLFHNQSPSQSNTNHWLTVAPEGTISNRDAIGARIYLTTPDGITQIREITSGQAHGGGDHKAAYFGIGQNTSGTLTVRWPSGILQEVGVVAADQRLHVLETITGVGESGLSDFQFRLLQNYPNPFNPITQIGFHIAENGFVSISVYDLLGREVAIIVNEILSPGTYSRQWDATGFPSGVYYYRVHFQASSGQSRAYSETRKLVLLK